MTEEEYFRKNYPDSCYGDKPLSPHWDFFQDGAEFGYNKANEWHYVSEKGFPKDEKAYFVIIDYGALGSECGVMENLNKDKPKNVIAWKEIVLPELKESE